MTESKNENDQNDHDHFDQAFWRACSFFPFVILGHFGGVCAKKNADCMAVKENLRTFARSNQCLD